ncbi:MAG: SAM-dependent methyltransferase YafE (UbiE paralog) [uncultured Thermomicrobiales bacterium]|uniref:SAM-dependent methyltransferase YafE (UbiE paralog) n=1 Tax=uncultured Thermomicrobiales bacterium TaxID=1645740 RepID=A0A6J4UMQ0_9BACT|nr:MAG: SAM-dependent methyltransferase YafE (UbiE paralog) [uncultured Thermomicrobiales bacterium]
MRSAAKDLVQRQYARHAEAYVQSATHASGDDLACLVTIVAPSGDDEALDKATGGGHVAAALAPLVRRVVASDLTAEMLTAAAGFFASKGLTNVETAEADAEALPFGDETFDIVTCRIAPHHFPRPDRFVSEAARVLRSGGRFGLIDTTVPAGPIGTWHNAFETVRDPSHVRSLTDEEWTGSLIAAGFQIRAIEHYQKRHEFADWTERSGMTAEARDALAAHMLGASAEILEAFQVERDGDRLIAFTDQKTLFFATTPD